MFTVALLVCAAVSLRAALFQQIFEIQVAGFAFLLGGVAMFAYQVWVWWRHNQQVRAYRTNCFAATDDSLKTRNDAVALFIYI